jgi:hypothetical protein
MKEQRVYSPLSTGSLPDAQQARIRLFTLVGAVMTLVTLVVAVLINFWQSYQEWGTLPGLNGNGSIIYGGLAAGIVMLSVYVIWAWLQWRDPNSD